MIRIGTVARRSALCLLAILMASSFPTATRAIDTEFYSANDILFYDPDAVGPCSASTNPGTGNVTIEDKIGQTMIAGFQSPSDATKATVLKFKFGGVYFNGKIDGSVTKQTFSDWNAGLPSQLMVTSDDEGGQIQRFLSGKKSAKEMGAMDTAGLKAYAQQVGTELADRGVTNVLGPVLDLDTGNQNAISPYDRSFSANSATISEKAGAYTEGLAASNIGTTFKHFPGIGKNTANTDHDYQQLNMDISQLGDDLAPYSALVTKSAKSAVMLANEVLTGWGTDPVGLNAQAVTYLRNMQFQGVIMTDDIGVFANYSSNKISLVDAVVKAYTAGVTMPLFRFTNDNEMNEIITAVKTKVPEATIDAAYQKVMQYKTLLGLKTTTTAATPASPTTPATPATPATPGATPPAAGGAGASVDLEDKEARKQYIFQALLGLGFTKEKAAAIWGNLAQESGDNLDPKALEYRGQGVPGYTGHGIVQWSWGRWRNDYGTAKDAQRTPNAARTSDLTDFAPYPPKPPLDENSLLGFAATLNKPWYDLGVQMAFIKKEMSPGGQRVVPSFMDSTSTNVEELTLIFGRKYESPSESDANYPNRIAKANLALQQYGNLPPIDPSTGVSSAAVSSCPAGIQTGASGGPTGASGQYDEGLLSVPPGGYGRNVWYFNQANEKLNALDSFYTQNGHTWKECACGPTTAITMVASFNNDANVDPAKILSEIAGLGGVVGGCPGQVSGIQAYFKNNGYDVVDIAGRKGFHSLTKADFDGIRQKLKDGYLVFTHTNGHFLGIYAADDSGNFYLFDPGARANSQPQKAFTEEQLNSGSGMAGPAAGYGLNELWAVKKNTPAATGGLKAV